MKREVSPMIFVILALLVSTALVLWTLTEVQVRGTEDLDLKYEESVAIKSRAFKTEVWIDGEHRDDCNYNGATGTLSCSKTRLTLTPTEGPKPKR